jgi:N-acetyl-alpha-D-muramate 1-phosphate uridylyltransferase
MVTQLSIAPKFTVGSSTLGHAQAMILAAGRGERMRPLTDTTPKPLLPVHGKPLMQWHLEALAREGFTQCVVNTAWLGEQIPEHFSEQNLSQIGNWPSYSLRSQLSKSEQIDLLYSHEGQDFGGALETAGGIARALPLLADAFWLAAGDVFAPSFAFERQAYERFVASPMLAHIWLVPNPPHNPRGDFGLSRDGLALNLPKDGAQPLYTYSTIGLFKQAMFQTPFCSMPSGNPQGMKAPLAPVLRAAMERALVSAELFEGGWTDVGTPERLQEINRAAIDSFGNIPQ